MSMLQVGNEGPERLTSLPSKPRAAQALSTVPRKSETLLPPLPFAAPRAVRGRSKTKGYTERAQGQWCWLGIHGLGDTFPEQLTSEVLL